MSEGGSAEKDSYLAALRMFFKAGLSYRVLHGIALPGKVVDEPD